MPETVPQQEATIRQFHEIRNFPTVIGCIDCTHIRIRKYGSDAAQYYINRKGYYSLNVQVVCDATLQIMDLVARWRGSTHDSRIFTESSIKQRFERREFRGRLLGDSGYRLEPYLFTPITRPQNVAEEHYSEAHISTRNTIERCFGVWKQRFQCLLHGMSVKMENIKPTIVALAILHNIAIKREGQIDFDAEEQLHHPALPEEDAHIEGGHRANINNAFLRAFVARHFNN
ncbi:hypothetical protein JYU34_015086 [Plutella xylostella]|uniref:DDE Tnp4 domain-containing protein n=1 Tax=Plutella xylostella TaxID=51655 RepID=A0ABQ7Q692_PLUXY|nr:putative nuclease HARBI1 [Plutella xylostella]KAG7300757.1 hypothetical protein JYU34_015086 [Plutella xylostella]